MSGALNVGIQVGVAAAGILGGGIESILIRPYRRITPGDGSAIIIPDCVIEETGRDDLQITEHPVEQGSVISDHAYKRPNEVTLRWAWTNSGKLASTIKTALGTLGSPAGFQLPTFSQAFGEGNVSEVYQSLVGLQNTRTPFTLMTGKRQYIDMLLASLSVTTNNTSEYSLMVVAVCRQVIIVSTEVQTAASNAGNNSTVQSGDQQPVACSPAQNNLLNAKLG